MSARGQYVRKKDSIGRYYYVPRAGGQRVARVKWEQDRKRVRERAPKPTPAPPPKVPSPKAPSRAPSPPSAPTPPPSAPKAPATKAPTKAPAAVTTPPAGISGWEELYGEEVEVFEVDDEDYDSGEA